MNILVIGANGKQGSLIVEEALKRNHNVFGVVKEEKCKNEKAIKIDRDLLELSEVDLNSIDCIISAFGSGFECDASINRKVINHLANLANKLGIHVIYLGGAGCLYVDDTKQLHVFEDKTHPEFLKEISRNIYLGYSDIAKIDSLQYTFVCPSLFFDFDGEKTNKYKVGTDLVPLKNKDGVSKISYKDFSVAMVDEAESKKYLRQLITICEE